MTDPTISSTETSWCEPRDSAVARDTATGRARQGVSTPRKPDSTVRTDPVHAPSVTHNRQKRVTLRNGPNDQTHQNTASQPLAQKRHRNRDHSTRATTAPHRTIRPDPPNRPDPTASRRRWAGVVSLCVRHFLTRVPGCPPAAWWVGVTSGLLIVEVCGRPDGRVWSVLASGGVCGSPSRCCMSGVLLLRLVGLRAGRV
jgi:hypothetical protein